MFPMTYTARATLEIGSGAVCSGRAVTTTTASNQVRTHTSPAPRPPPPPRTDPQTKLLSALCGPGTRHSSVEPSVLSTQSATIGGLTGKTNKPRGPEHANDEHGHCERELTDVERKCTKAKHYSEKCPQSWVDNVDHWYKSMPNYTEPLRTMYGDNHISKRENMIYDLTAAQGDIKYSHNNDEHSPKRSKALPSIDVISPENNQGSNFDVNLTYSLKRMNKENQKESSNLLDIYHDDENVLTKKNDSVLEHNIQVRKIKKHDLVIPSLKDINPRNVRPMSIGRPQPKHQNDLKTENSDKLRQKEIELQNMPVDINSNTVEYESKCMQEASTNMSENNKVESPPVICTSDCCTTKKREQLKELVDMFNKLSSYSNAEIELKEVQNSKYQRVRKDSFSKYVALQQKLIVEIESLQDEIQNHSHVEHSASKGTENTKHRSYFKILPNNENKFCKLSEVENKEYTEIKTLSSISEENEDVAVQLCSDEYQNNKVKSDSDLSAELSNNAYVLLTLPSSNNTESFVSESATKPKSGKKKENLSLAPSHTNKKEDVLNKNILKVLLFENLFKNNSNEKSGIPGVSSITNEEVGHPQ